MPTDLLQGGFTLALEPSQAKAAPDDLALTRFEPFDNLEQSLLAALREDRVIESGVTREVAFLDWFRLWWLAGNGIAIAISNGVDGGAEDPGADGGGRPKTVQVSAHAKCDFLHDFAGLNAITAYRLDGDAFDKTMVRGEDFADVVLLVGSKFGPS